MGLTVEQLPLLDDSQIRSLREAVGGETELIIDLLDTFKSEGDAAMETLESACAQHDDVALRKITHFLAGSAANLGINRFSQYNRTIEEALIDEDDIDYGSIMPRMRTLYVESMAAIRGAFGV